MKIDLASIVEYWPLFLKGFGVSILISVSSFFLALVSGLVVAAARQSRFSILVWLAIGYIELFRTIPFMIQLFLFFYVLPFYGVRLPAIVVGVIALSAHGCAYYAEIIRGAVQSVPKGQLDSARAVGMSNMQAMRHVIFPQMLGYFLPPSIGRCVPASPDWGRGGRSSFSRSCAAGTRRIRHVSKLRRRRGAEPWLTNRSSRSPACSSRSDASRR